MHQLPKHSDPNLLVGFGGSDDAAVYQLNDEQAIINTLDFFTPIDDDPYTYGRIAATNALSDVFAMGGRPITAMNIVCFPCDMDPDILGEILKGGSDAVRAAGAIVVGGHSITDDEPKYGLSVTGLVHPDKIWQNRGAKPGDQLILTKPLGTGILTTAKRGGLLDEKSSCQLIKYMCELNKTAAEAAKQSGADINACTDITGFGLIGHLAEMCSDDISFEINAASIPYMDRAAEMAEIGIVPAGAYRNMKFYSAECNIACAEFTDELEAIVYDPQTSGGLVFAVPKDQSDQLLRKLYNAGLTESSIIADVTERQGNKIIIRGQSEGQSDT